MTGAPKCELDRRSTRPWLNGGGQSSCSNSKQSSREEEGTALARVIPLYPLYPLEGDPPVPKSNPSPLKEYLPPLHSLWPGRPIESASLFLLAYVLRAAVQASDWVPPVSR